MKETICQICFYCPQNQKCTYISSVLGCITFEVYDWGKVFWVSFQ